MAFLRKIPIVATAFNLSDFVSMFDTKRRRERFEQELSGYLGAKYLFTLNSGTSAFYLILKALSSLSPDKKEVILPAYTASSLVLAIQRLGLKVVLCDISLETFNLDITRAADLVSEGTLCVVAVHLFGLACDIDGLRLALREKNKNATIVEDCAQAMGTIVGNAQVGAKSDISLYSFNRGKNLSTCSGGAISTNNEIFADLIKKETAKLSTTSILSITKIIFEFALLYLVVKPFIYNMLYQLLNVFRGAKQPHDFSVSNYTDIQAAVGSSLLKRLESFSRRRFYNGEALYRALINKKGIKLARLLNSSRPAYNRFPILIQDPELKEKIRLEFQKESIDSSGMYEKPLHKIFDLGPKAGDLPNAEKFSGMLLTIPSHPLVGEDVLRQMKKIFEVNL